MDKFKQKWVKWSEKDFSLSTNSQICTSFFVTYRDSAEIASIYSDPENFDISRLHFEDKIS